MKPMIISIALCAMLGGCATPPESTLVFNPAFEKSAFALNGRSPEAPVKFWSQPHQQARQVSLVAHDCSATAGTTYSPEQIRAQQLSDTKWVAPLCLL